MANQTTTDATIFEARRGDHDKQRNLVDLITKTSGESDGRVELFERLSAQLEAHAATEERDFSVPLMQQDLTQKAARHSVAEHKGTRRLGREAPRVRHERRVHPRHAAPSRRGLSLADATLPSNRGLALRQSGTPPPVPNVAATPAAAVRNERNPHG